ncbi:hypothetical protein JKP88DRAFT_253780 [Tribonema minus]|uniref:Uncharacterized protein n=1 Tax=Tribonema minus TaxID=303371 RepID=A0A835ZAJ9_9STRA|nr:hypothetical protein JKP88DRAFT_253780 [Tribonema minus]
MMRTHLGGLRGLRCVPAQLLLALPLRRRRADVLRGLRGEPLLALLALRRRRRARLLACEHASTNHACHAHMYCKQCEPHSLRRCDQVRLGCYAGSARWRFMNAIAALSVRPPPPVRDLNFKPRRRRLHACARLANGLRDALAQAPRRLQRSNGNEQAATLSTQHQELLARSDRGRGISARRHHGKRQRSAGVSALSASLRVHKGVAPSAAGSRTLYMKTAPSAAALNTCSASGDAMSAVTALACAHTHAAAAASAAAAPPPLPTLPPMLPAADAAAASDVNGNVTTIPCAVPATTAHLSPPLPPPPPLPLLQRGRAPAPPSAEALCALPPLPPQMAAPAPASARCVRRCAVPVSRALMPAVRAPLHAMSTLSVHELAEAVPAAAAAAALGTAKDPLSVALPPPAAAAAAATAAAVGAGAAADGMQTVVRCLLMRVRLRRRRAQGAAAHEKAADLPTSAPVTAMWPAPDPRVNGNSAPGPPPLPPLPPLLSPPPPPTHFPQGPPCPRCPGIYNGAFARRCGVPHATAAETTRMRRYVNAYISERGNPVSQLRVPAAPAAAGALERCRGDDAPRGPRSRDDPLEVVPRRRAALDAPRRLADEAAPHLTRQGVDASSRAVRGSAPQAPVVGGPRHGGDGRGVPAQALHAPEVAARVRRVQRQYLHHAPWGSGKEVFSNAC